MNENVGFTSRLFSLLEDLWIHLPSQIEDDGLKYIGNFKLEWYIHRVYPGINEKEILELEHRLEVSLPKKLRDLYKIMSSLISFPDAGFAIYGHVTESNRKWSNRVFSIIDYNRKFQRRYSQ